MDKTPATLVTQPDEIEKVFNRIDTNGDGKLSPTELGSVLSGLGSAASAEEMALVMSELDADGDGFVDLKEFKAFRWCPGDDDSEAYKELKEAFDLYDKNGDGKISAAELQSVLRGLGEEATAEDCRRMIGAFDVDGDEYIDFEEFKKMMIGG